MLKNCRPSGANPLTQFAFPAQPVLKKLPPVRGEPPARFACPGQPVLKKLPPVRGEPLDRCRITGEICDTIYFIIKCTRSCVKRNRPAKPDEFF